MSGPHAKCSTSTRTSCPSCRSASKPPRRRRRALPPAAGLAGRYLPLASLRSRLDPHRHGAPGRFALFPQHDSRKAGSIVRPLINSTFVSLDGVVNHMEKWHFDYIDEETDAFALTQLRDAEAMLMGQGHLRRLRRSLAATRRGVRRAAQPHAQVRRLNDTDPARLGRDRRPRRRPRGRRTRAQEPGLRSDPPRGVRDRFQDAARGRSGRRAASLVPPGPGRRRRPEGMLLAPG